jgi:hypothetical protein
MSVTVTDLNSIRIQIPYSFNFLNLCTPSTPITQTKTLSDIILGTEYTITPYTININKDEKCKFICQKDLLTEGTLEEFESLFEGKIIKKKIELPLC